MVRPVRRAVDDLLADGPRCHTRVVPRAEDFIQLYSPLVHLTEHSGQLSHELVDHLCVGTSNQHIINPQHQDDVGGLLLLQVTNLIRHLSLESFPPHEVIKP